MKAESVCIPEKYKILSGSVLKCIALFTMIVDHVGLHLLRNSGIVLLYTSAGPLELFTLMRKVGRLAFPIYCFLLVEGFLHTHDRRKYGLNLLAFALISEIPWNLEHTGALYCPSQNVFFTLFLGYAGMCCIEELKERPLEQLISLIALVLVAMNLKADYGIGGFAFILVMYLLREQKILQAIAGMGAIGHFGRIFLHIGHHPCFSDVLIVRRNIVIPFLYGMSSPYLMEKLCPKFKRIEHKSMIYDF